jgi:GalNAc-alpha-(1->4)-GalNAc-alpha-(1->3)-diNAcBac-PP-undecaprenol alpha-1,4-N-acetyl-D-galactosaminyltransferase
MSALANCYVDRGVDVTLVTLDSPERIAAHSLSPRVNQVNVHVSGGRSVVTKIIARIKRLLHLRQHIKSKQPSAVLSFMTPTNILTIVACIGLSVRCVISERTNPARFSYSRLTDWLRKLMYRFATIVVVQTPEIANWFQIRVKGTFHIISNFISQEKFETGLVRQPTIIAVGRLGPEKGFDDLINAFALLVNRFPEWRLEILGEGPHRSLLQSLINQHGLGNKVTLTGFVSNPGRYMSTAAIYAQPSRFEGFPNALLEAMANGAAVLASHEAGDMLIQNGVNGLLVPADDVRQLADALERLMEDAPLRDNLGGYALAVRETFSQGRIIQLWDEALFPGHPFINQETHNHG